MEIILMRHGKAQELEAGISDEQRQLTPEGRKKTEAVSRGLAHCLRNYSDIQIWSSPAVRARQTAEIVAEALGKLKVRLHPAIGVGDLDILAGDWVVVEKENPSTTIIMVGHEPYLGAWAERLTGCILPFKKASVASFEIGGGAAKLRWYAAPSVLACIGKKK